MNNLGKSSEKSKKYSSMIYKLAKIIIVFLLILVSLIFLYVTYQDRASNIYPTTKTEVQFQNGNITLIHNSTVIIENYLPGNNFTAYPIVYRKNSTTQEYDYFTNNASTLKELNIKINTYEIKVSYGDQEVIPPRKVSPSSIFPEVPIIGLTKTTINIDWNQSKTESNNEEFRSINLRYSSSKDYEGRIVTRKEFLNIRILSAFSDSIPYLFFIASGLVISWIVFDNGKLMNNYGILSKFPGIYEKATSDQKKAIEKSLSNIIAFPKKLGKSWKLFFGLSIFVIKALVNNRCKENHESIDSNKKIVPFRRKTLKKIFEKYKKQTFEKIQDTLPEFKTIGIVITLLASLGITFSFNVNAMVPVVYSVVLFYFFLNLGSLLQFVGKSIHDLKWTIVTICFASVVMALPTIIEILRHAEI